MRNSPLLTGDVALRRLWNYWQEEWSWRQLLWVSPAGRTVEEKRWGEERKVALFLTWEKDKRQMYENTSAENRRPSVLPEAQRTAPRERKKVRKMPETVFKHAWQSCAPIQRWVGGECWSVSDPGPPKVWWIKRHGQKQRSPPLNRGANPSKTSPSLSISPMASISPHFLNHLLNGPFSLV